MRTTRAFSAAVLGLAIATGTIGAPALILPNAVAQGDAVNPANIDPNAEASLTVHKRLNAATTGTPTGNPDATVGGTALPGIDFTITPISGYNIATNDGFAQLRALTPSAIPAANLNTGAAQTVRTNAAGEAEFTGLAVGAYLVRETVPAGFTAPEGGSVIPAPAFIVFLPMTNPQGASEWNYDVHVYPKNTSSTATKEVNDTDEENAGYNVGDTITYTITSDIPSVPVNGAIEKYNVKDTLPEEVTLTAENQAAIRVALSDGTTLTAGTDFTVATVGQEVTITLTEAGRAKLTAAGSTAKVLTTIPVTVTTAGADGQLTNQAEIIFNNGTGTGDVTTPTNEVETRIGELQILKHKEGNTGEALEGAVFELHRCAPGTTELQSGPLTVNGATSWTTNAQGLITIDGLHVTDYANGAPVDNIVYDYCLVESKAPNGYELLPNPVNVTFTWAEVNNTADGTDAVTRPVSVPNIETTSTNLPMTGGVGVGILMAIGAGLIGLGAFAAKRASRKS